MMNEESPVELRVNDAPYPVAPGTSVSDLLAKLGLPPTGVLVEHNGTGLLPREWATTALANGDRLEIMRVVAGG